MNCCWRFPLLAAAAICSSRMNWLISGARTSWEEEE